MKYLLKTNHTNCSTNWRKQRVMLLVFSPGLVGTLYEFMGKDNGDSIELH